MTIGRRAENRSAALLPGTREILVFKSSYRIIYRMDEAVRIVHVLRFWQSHRDEPDDVL